MVPIESRFSYRTPAELWDSAAKGVSDFGYGALLTLLALVGAWFGAQVAVEMDEVIFKRVLAGIMLAVLFVTLFSPTKKLQGGD